MGFVLFLWVARFTHSHADEQKNQERSIISRLFEQPACPKAAADAFTSWRRPSSSLKALILRGSLSGDDRVFIKVIFPFHKNITELHLP